jgi:hypothetical protein
MNIGDRRGLNLGVAMVALGIYFILFRSLHFRGPGPILLLIGAVLLALSALRGFRGPVVPAGVLLGLGAGFVLQEPLERWMPHWASLLLGLGAGLLLAGGLGRMTGQQRRAAPIVPGIILIAIASCTALSQSFDIPESLYDAAWRLWPFALVAAGVILVLQAARHRKTD